MHKFILHGKEFELNDKGLLLFLSKVVEEYCVVAKAYYRMHIEGFPDLTELFFQIQKKQVDFANQLEKTISDKELLTLFLAAEKGLISLASLDNQFINCIAAYVGLPPPQNKRDKRKIIKRMDTIILGTEKDGITQGPIWVMSDNYQSLLKSNEAEFNMFMDSCDQVYEKIRSMSSL